jgi:ankyrin repeat protein
MTTVSGAAVDISDEAGTTPLMMACEQGEHDSAMLFLSLGANVHRTNRDGVTSLMQACSCKRESSSTIQLLLRHGSCTTDRDNEGFGLSSYISYSSHILTLHQAGYSFNGPVNPLSNKRTTYLMDLAGRQSSLHLVKALLTTDIDVNERDEEGRTALDYAIDNIPSEEAEYMVALLQAAGAVHGQRYSDRLWWGRQSDKRPQYEPSFSYYEEAPSPEDVCKPGLLQQEHRQNQLKQHMGFKPY